MAKRIQPNAKNQQIEDTGSSREMIQRRVQEASQRFGASSSDAAANAQQIAQNPNSFRAD